MPSFLDKLRLGIRRLVNTPDGRSEVLIYLGLSLIVGSATGFYYALRPVPRQESQQLDVGGYLQQLQTEPDNAPAIHSLRSTRPVTKTSRPDSSKPIEMEAAVQPQILTASLKTDHYSSSSLIKPIPDNYQKSDQEWGPGALLVTVWDEDHKTKTLAGIQVILAGQGDRRNITRSGTTNGRGDVDFETLPWGRYAVRTESSEYWPKQQEVNLDGRGGNGTSIYFELKARRSPTPSPPSANQTVPPTPNYREIRQPSDGTNGQLVVDCPKELVRGRSDSCRVVYKPPPEGTPPDVIEGYTTLAAFKLIGLSDSHFQSPFKPLYLSQEEWNIPIEPGNSGSAKLAMQIQLENRSTGNLQTLPISEIAMNMGGPVVINRLFTENQQLGGLSLLGVVGFALVGRGLGRRRTSGVPYFGSVSTKMRSSGIGFGPNRRAGLFVLDSSVGAIGQTKIEAVDLATDADAEPRTTAEDLESAWKSYQEKEYGTELSPATPQYKRINAWLAERVDEPEKPLNLEEFYTLNFQVGQAVAASLITTGEANISLSDIPDEGLDTQWMIMSSNVMLRAFAGDAEVKVTENVAAASAEARFSLRIPKEGESDIRQLRVAALTFKAELRIIIYANDRIYRQFKVELKVISGDRVDGPDSAASIAGEVIHIPGRYTALRPPHEWQTPPGNVDITVYGGAKAHFKSSTPAGVLDTDFSWLGAQALVKGPISNLRKRAETFRETFSDELNDVDAQDLDQRLARLKQSPGDFWQQNLADGPHNQAWAGKTEKSNELYELAYYGYRLYQQFFPDPTMVRKALDSLDPGWRVNIYWSAQSDQSWVPNVPWGLLYKKAPVRGEAIDPMNFWGLRFRINYSAHAIDNLQSSTLGSLEQTVRGYGLYWGKQEQEIADEAAWQQNHWTQWANQKFVPDSSEMTITPRDQLLALLNTPSQQPMPLMYLFCQCDLGDDGIEAVLRFGNSNQVADNIRETDLNLIQFKDQPLVFINACTSAGSDPYVANQLEEIFFDRGCRAYLGTEIKVPIRMASRFASIFYYFFYRSVDPAPIAAGEAVYQTKQFLWREYRNLGGLFYTYINQYELYMATDDELGLPHS